MIVSFLPDFAAAFFVLREFHSALLNLCFSIQATGKVGRVRVTASTAAIVVAASIAFSAVLLASLTHLSKSASL